MQCCKRSRPPTAPVSPIRQIKARRRFERARRLVWGGAQEICVRNSKSEHEQSRSECEQGHSEPEEMVWRESITSDDEWLKSWPWSHLKGISSDQNTGMAISDLVLQRHRHGLNSVCVRVRVCLLLHVKVFCSVCFAAKMHLMINITQLRVFNMCTVCQGCVYTGSSA